MGSATLAGPMEAQQLNRTLYAGYGELRTIQQAVDKATKIGGAFQVVIPTDYAGGEDPITVLRGSASIYILDLRGGQWQSYIWFENAYQPEPINPKGGIVTSAINRTIYVGTGGKYGTIQGAVTDAVAFGIKRMVEISPGYTGNEVIGDLTGGSTDVYLTDTRTASTQNYIWNGTNYVPAPVSLAGDVLLTKLTVTGEAIIAGTIKGADGSLNIEGDANVNGDVYANNGIFSERVTAPNAEFTSLDADTLEAINAVFSTCEVDSSPVRTFANTPDGPGEGMVWPTLGIPVSEGNHWKNPSIDPASIAYLDAANVFTENQTAPNFIGGNAAGTTATFGSSSSPHPYGLLGAINNQSTTIRGGWKLDGYSSDFSKTITWLDMYDDATGPHCKFPNSDLDVVGFINTPFGVRISSGTTFVTEISNSDIHSRFISIYKDTTQPGAVELMGMDSAGGQQTRYFQGLWSAGAPQCLLQGDTAVTGQISATKNIGTNADLYVAGTSFLSNGWLRLGRFPIAAGTPSISSDGANVFIENLSRLMVRNAISVFGTNSSPTTLTDKGGIAWSGNALYVDAFGTGGARGELIFRQSSANGANLQEVLHIDSNGNSTFTGSVFGRGLAANNPNISGTYIGVASDATSPKIRMVFRNAAANQSMWDIVCWQSQMRFVCTNDADSELPWMVVNRAGGAATQVSLGASGLIDLNAPQVSVVGNLTVSGAKAFKIPHPLHKEKELVHVCLEGPEVGVYYRGEGETVDGIATITLPDYFEALTLPDQRTVQLTERYDNEDNPSFGCFLAAGRVRNGQFTVRSSAPSAKFYWEVKAVRGDIAPLEVEPTKPQEKETQDGKAGIDGDGKTEDGKHRAKDKHAGAAKGVGAKGA